MLLASVAHGQRRKNMQVSRAALLTSVLFGAAFLAYPAGGQDGATSRAGLESPIGEGRTTRVSATGDCQRTWINASKGGLVGLTLPEARDLTSGLILTFASRFVVLVCEC